MESKDIIKVWNATSQEGYNPDVTAMVLAWITESDTPNMFNLYLGGYNGVRAGTYDTKASTFENFTEATSIDVSNLHVENSVNIAYMFRYCTKLTSVIGLDKWNVSNVENALGLFYACESTVSLDGMTDWDTSNINEMTVMFSGCKALGSIDFLSNWDMSKVEYTSYMFGRCYMISSLDALLNWDTATWFQWKGCSNSAKRYHRSTVYQTGTRAK